MLFRRGRKDRKATVSKVNAAKAPVSVVSPEVNKHIADDDAAAASAQTDPDQADVSAQLLAAQLRTLRAQISPHFLYNALNAVAAIIPMDPHRARELLLDFADFTRYTLRHEAELTGCRTGGNGPGAHAFTSSGSPTPAASSSSRIALDLGSMRALVYQT